MEMVLKSPARNDSCTQSWFRNHMKIKENTGSQMGHTKSNILIRFWVLDATCITLILPRGHSNNS